MLTDMQFHEVAILLLSPINFALLLSFIIGVLIIIKYLYGGIKTKWFETGIQPNRGNCSNRATCQYFNKAFEDRVLDAQYIKMEEYFVQLGRFFYEHSYKIAFNKLYPDEDIAAKKEFKQFNALSLVFKYDCYIKTIQTTLKDNGFVRIYNQKNVSNYLEKKVALLYAHSCEWWDLNYPEFNLNPAIDRKMIYEIEIENRQIFEVLTTRFLVECLIISLREDTIKYERIACHGYPSEKKIESLYMKHWKMSPKQMVEKFAVKPYKDK